MSATLLPDRLSSCNDFARLSESVAIALDFLDAVFQNILDDKPPTSFDNGMLQEIAIAYEEFWIVHYDEFDEQETRHGTPSTSLHARPTTKHIIALVMFLARLTLYLCKSQETQTKMMTYTANSFAAVRNSWLQQTAQPIMCYTAHDLVDALDTLAFAWFDIDYDTPEFKQYVYMLSLRYAMFLRVVLPESEYGNDTTLMKKMSIESPLRVPSRILLGIVESRFASFIGSIWRCAQHKTVTELPLCSEQQQRISIADPHKAGLEIATLCSRYCAEGANSILIRETFAAVYMELILWPGDRGVFAVRKKSTPIATNIIKLLHGKRVTHEAFQRGIIMGPRSALCGAIDDLTKHVPVSARSAVSFESEVAALCTMNALFKGKYGIAWTTEFLVTASNYDGCNLNKFPRIAYISNTFDLLYDGIRLRTSSIFETLVWWLMVVHVVYHDMIPLAAISMESEASKVSRAIEQDRSYIAKKRYAAAASSASSSSSSSSSIDIGELCNVAVNCDQSKFVVNALWSDSASIVVDSLVPGGPQRSMVIE